MQNSGGGMGMSIPQRGQWQKANPITQYQNNGSSIPTMGAGLISLRPTAQPEFAGVRQNHARYQSHAGLSPNAKNTQQVETDQGVNNANNQFSTIQVNNRKRLQNELKEQYLEKMKLDRDRQMRERQ